MKQIKRHFHVIIVMLGLITMISCEDLAFGDKFLQKPPSTDVTIVLMIVRLTCGQPFVTLGLL